MIDKTKRELLFSVTKKDLNVTYFKGHGKGGQHRNKHANGVRIHHPDSCVTVASNEQRSQSQNKKVAIKKLGEHPDFIKWAKLRAAKFNYTATEIREQIEKKVNELIKPENLKIEVIENE